MSSLHAIGVIVGESEQRRRRVMLRRLGIRRLVIRLLVILGLALSVQPVRAQSTPLSVSVDRTELTTDETLTLTIRIHVAGQNVPQPTLPTLSGFEALGSSSTQQLSIINGAPSTTLIYSYQLRPVVAGELTIGAVSIELHEERYTSPPLTITVTQGSGRLYSDDSRREQDLPSALGDKDFYVEALVDNPEPYLGENLVYTFRFFETNESARNGSLPSARPYYDGPAFTGFWNEREVDYNWYRATTNGRRYSVTELSTVLFPTAEGDYMIEPSRLEVPDSAFQTGGTIQTDRVRIRVQPLPPGAPDSFVNAVGVFDIHADVSTTQIRDGESITLRVTVSGEGNVPIVADPQWPQESPWRRFEKEDRVTTQVRTGVVQGQHVYEWLLVPTSSGTLWVPSLEISYFNPTDEQYHTIATESIPIMVLPSYSGETEAPVAPKATSDVETRERPPLMVGTGGERAAPLVTFAGYWGLWLLPLFGATAAFSRRRRREHRRMNALAIRSSQARGQALKKLDRVAKLAPGSAQAQAAYALLYEYLGARLGRNVGGETHTALRAELASRGIAPRTIETTLDYLQFTEFNQFQPDVSPDPVETLPEQLRSLITELDRQLHVS